MLTRRAFTLGAACALIVFATPALATDASALTFVTDIYNGYKGKTSPAVRSTAIRRSGAISSRRWQP